MMTNVTTKSKQKNKITDKGSYLEMDVSTPSKGKVSTMIDRSLLGVILNGYRWSASGQPGSLYVSQRAYGKCVQLHRLITKAPSTHQVDHINRNTLDNRLVNLRLCNHHENMRNQGVNKSNKVGLKGVTKYNSLFRSSIYINGKQIHIGLFENPFDAAAAYDKKAIIHFGQFARTNASLGLLDSDFLELFDETQLLDLDYQPTKLHFQEYKNAGGFE